MPSTSSSSQASTKNQSKDSVKKSPFGVTDDNESIIYGSSPVPKLVSTTKNGKVNLGSKKLPYLLSKSKKSCFSRKQIDPLRPRKLSIDLTCSGTSQFSRTNCSTTRSSYRSVLQRGLTSTTSTSRSIKSNVVLKKMKTTKSNKPQISDKANEEIDLIMNRWKVPFLFPAYINNTYFPKTDITQFVSDMKHKDKMFVIFDPKIYTVDQVTNVYDSVGFTTLTMDLCRLSHTFGFRLIRNGPCKRVILGVQQDVTTFCCSCCHKYKGNCDKRKTEEFRTLSYRNDRKNCRGIVGRNLSRRRRTSLPLTSGKTCCYKFFVGCLPGPEYRFFVCSGIGNINHIHHSQDILTSRTTSTRFLTSPIKEDISLMKECNTSPVSISNIIHKKYKHSLSRQKINYVAETQQNIQVYKRYKMNPIEKLSTISKRIILII